MSSFLLKIADQTETRAHSESLVLEWLETNGLGGYSSSTVSGAHSRSYHGLFIVQSPLVNERLVLLSKLDEMISHDGKSFELSAARYPGSIHPRGYEHLESFSRELFPAWHYKIGDITLKKELCCIHSRNIVVLRYESSHDISLELKPFFAFRNYHGLLKKKEELIREIAFLDGTLSVAPYGDIPPVLIQVKSSSHLQNLDWYYNFELTEEKSRGFEYLEDLFTTGTLTCTLKAGEPQFVLLSTEKHPKDSAPSFMNAEKIRRNELLETAGAATPLGKSLVLAADQFIFKRPDSITSIIAGYPWFTDWGRDTMISIPGLCLATKRYAEAREILLGYAEFIRDGLLPNRFPDEGTEPEYHTVDAALWYVVACYEYVKVSGDADFMKRITPRILAITDRYRAGTKYGIRTDSDGLIACGDSTTNLTWMDARVHGVPVTPRNGKPVEISSLWYNALKILAEFLGDAKLEKEAEITKASFERRFWCSKGYLFDYVQDSVSDDSVRPNQLFALSLPFPLISGDKALSILSVIEKELLTPVGLRTLSPEDPRYCANYEGPSEKRDAAYHQGTVWMWLLSHYVKAAKRFGSPGNFKLDSIKNDLARCGMGTLSEIYDGEYPHHPRGCIAQAWSVAAAMELVVLV